MNKINVWEAANQLCEDLWYYQLDRASVIYNIITGYMTICNHVGNILGLFAGRANFPMTTSEAKDDY